MVVQLNVLHWRTNKLSICNYLRRRTPDLVLLNSTGSSDDDIIRVPGYVVYQRNISGGMHDGSAICVKTGVKHRQMCNILSEDFLMVGVESAYEEICIATTYLPPRRIPAELYPDLLRIAGMHQPAYVLADLNARHRRIGGAGANLQGKCVSQLLALGRLRHLGPDFNTYFLGTKSGKPDVVLSNRYAHHNIRLEPGEVTSSDHIPIEMRVSSSPIQIPIRPRKATGKANWQQFSTLCQELVVGDLVGCDRKGVDGRIGGFLQQMARIVDKVTPVIRYRTLPSSEVTPEVVALMQQLHELYMKVSDGTASRAETLVFQSSRAELRRLLIDGKRRMWDATMAMASLGPPKKFWRTVKRYMGECVAPQIRGALKDCHGTEVSGDREVAEAFSTKLRSQCSISDVENRAFSADFQDRIESSFLRRRDALVVPARVTGGCNEISEGELRLYVSELRKGAPGESGVTKRYLENMPHSTMEAFRRLLNGALEIGHFPLGFKHAKVRMIPKGAKTASVADFRPISLLEVFGKLFERALRRRLLTAMEEGDVLSDMQFGFRTKRGTEMAIALVYETIAQKLSSGKRVNLVLRDVKSAFDKVWHVGLKYKVLKLPLMDNIKGALCSFLDDRTLEVWWGTARGGLVPLEAGTPQGAVLSPTLYNLYVAKMPRGDGVGMNVVYADDVSQVIWGNTPDGLRASTSKHIRRVNKFERSWKIQTNVVKFKVVSIGHRDPRPIIVSPNLSIPLVRTGMMLGMKIASTGLSKHVGWRCSMAEARAREISKFGQLSRDRKQLLYNAVVRSVLTYPAIPLNAVNRRGMSRMQLLQNRGVRFVCGGRRNDRVRTASYHGRINQKAVNSFLFDRGLDIWKKLRPNMCPEVDRLYEGVRAGLRTDNNRGFPSSLQKYMDWFSSGRPPEPCYS